MGIRYEVSGSHPGNYDLLRQKTPGEHVWTAMAVFRLTSKNISGDGPINMDRENLAGVELGCYVCEQPYTAEYAKKPCPGEPA